MVVLSRSARGTYPGKSMVVLSRSARGTYPGKSMVVLSRSARGTYPEKLDDLGGVGLRAGFYGASASGISNTTGRLFAGAIRKLAAV